MTRRRFTLRSRAAWAGVVAVVVVVVAGWYAWSALQVRSELLSARTHGRALQQKVLAGDAHGAGQQLQALTDDLTAARDHTGGWTWRLAEHTPVVGDDARAVAAVAAAGSDVATGLRPLVGQVDAGFIGRLVPRGGRIDVAALAQLSPSLSRASDSLQQATSALRHIDAGGLLGIVRTPFTALRDQLDGAASGLRAAVTASRLAPDLLGEHGPRDYLLMFANNAEIRANGGMPGAWAVLRADHGRLQLTRQGSATEIPEFAHPVLPQTPTERALYGVQVATYFQDTGFTPDFPRTADLVRAMWQQRFGQRLDGVASIDTVTLGYLLGATGSLSSHGVTLTPANATDELLNGVYQRFATNAEQDAFYRDVARQVFDRVSGGSAKPPALLSALARSVDEHRTRLHLFEQRDQQALAGSTIAAELPTVANGHPQLGVYVNDATGSKMGYYLRRTLTAKPTSCAAGRQSIDAATRFTLRKAAPGTLNDFITGNGQLGTPKGYLTVVAQVYGPVGGRLRDFRLDGKRFEADQVRYDGRPVATLVLELHGGQHVDVTWTADSGPEQRGDIELTQTPGVGDEPAAQVVPSGC